jgi:hypothetical protein
MTPLCVYEVDADDRLVRVDDGWRRFARANGAPEYAEDAGLIGRPLLGFISDGTTKLIYDALLQRARSGGRPVDVPFRCDSPGERRWLEMRIAPLDGRALRFETFTVRTEPRDAAPLLDRSVPRSGPMLRMCSWCKDVDTAHGWQPIERAVTTLRVFGGETVPPITHGICPVCVTRFEAPAREVREIV